MLESQTLMVKTNQMPMSTTLKERRLLDMRHDALITFN